MGANRTVAPRLCRKGDHQLDGIALVLVARIRSRTNPTALSSAWPRQTRRHHWESQWQIQLAHCRSAAGGRS
jgi:hypothetical protein